MQNRYRQWSGGSPLRPRAAGELPTNPRRGAVQERPNFDVGIGLLPRPRLVVHIGLAQQVVLEEIVDRPGDRRFGRRPVTAAAFASRSASIARSR